MSRKVILMFCKKSSSGNQARAGAVRNSHQPTTGDFASSRLSKPAICAVLTTAAIAMSALGMVGCNKSNAAVPNIVTEVLVAHPVQRDVPVHNEWVASLDGYVNAEIRPQVSGYIISQNYKEGAVVRKRPGAVRHRPAAVPGDSRPRQGRPCSG